jgi:hypothetical protein
VPFRKKWPRTSEGWSRTGARDEFEVTEPPAGAILTCRGRPQVAVLDQRRARENDDAFVVIQRVDSAALAPLAERDLPSTTEGGNQR